MKATSAICGPNDDVVIPRNSKKTDWEVELGVIIGSPTKYVSESNALNHVAGYCVINDLSERAFQLESTGQWTKGKSADTFGPIGPWLVTKDEVPDPQNLNLWLKVNGQQRQNGTTKTMIFTVAHIVSYLSRFMSLHPGDIISTGTPPGVGMGQKPQVFLAPRRQNPTRHPRSRRTEPKRHRRSDLVKFFATEHARSTNCPMSTGQGPSYLPARPSLY